MVTTGRGEHWEELDNVNYIETRARARSQVWEEGREAERLPKACRAHLMTPRAASWEGAECQEWKPALVAHTDNHSYLGSQGRRKASLSPAWATYEFEVSLPT